MMLGRAPYFLTNGCTRRLMHMNLMNRPSSRHYDKVPAFLAALASKEYRGFGVRPDVYTMADLHDLMDWGRWMYDSC
jgi:hypothetical protein